MILLFICICSLLEISEMRLLHVAAIPIIGIEEVDIITLDWHHFGSVPWFVHVKGSCHNVPYRYRLKFVLQGVKNRYRVLIYRFITTVKIR